MKELYKSRTWIAFALYATFIALALKGKVDEQAVISVVSVLMGFFFGERSGKNGTKTDNKV
jgi:chromate transport protein ChrA